jgi:MFS transporter, DHA1 family, multidrug resistance protein
MLTTNDDKRIMNMYQEESCRGRHYMNWKANLFVLWFGQFMVMLGMTMIIPFMPYYIQEMGITDPKAVTAWAGVIFAGNFVTAFLFQPLWGSLSDRFGRKIMILRSGFGMALVMVLMGFAQLLILRLINGTISGYTPAATSLVAANTPKEKLGFAMGVLQSGTVAGTILGPLIGGGLSIWVGYRPIFYITAALLTMAALLAMRFVHEQFDREQAAAQPRRSILNNWQTLRPYTQLQSLFGVTFMIQFALFSTMPLMPVFVQQLHGNTANLALFSGLVAASTGISNMIASPLLGRLSDRIGPVYILTICLLGASLTFIPHAFVTSVWQLLALRFALGIFIGGLIPSVNALLRRNAPEGMEGVTYSFNTSFLSLGNVIGPILGGLLAGLITIEGVFVIASVLFMLNFIWVRKSLQRT